jgi:hypothetical protein
MMRFLSSLFGCAHQRCTFPITSRKGSAETAPNRRADGTYIVCLNCGREFPYDWKLMKVMTGRAGAANVA